MNKLILLKKQDGMIVAEHYFQGKPDEETIKLFGTYILPTPYQDSFCLRTAREIIQKLNPDDIVATEGNERE